ncbi:MAG: metallophosphoesterase family protein [Clostridiales bacterium]|jgi:predicted phosphodiesterase|nr:metallophosphoesterase family protein [Clostridiales bacterium]
MERIAILSDIHGNMTALRAVLKDIEQRGLKHLICLGDLAGKGPGPAEAVDMITDRCRAVVRGNWDHAIAMHASEFTLWHRAQLGKKRLSYLRELPIYLEFYMSGRLIRLCHAAPHDMFYRTFQDSEQTKRLKLFEPTETLNLYSDIVGYGDIHMAYIDHISGRTVFNAGSVGNPLDITQASYAVIEGEYGAKELSPFSLSLIRVPYDIDKAVDDALKSDMPEKDAYINELRTAIYRGNVHKEVK